MGATARTTEMSSHSPRSWTHGGSTPAQKSMVPASARADTSLQKQWRQRLHGVGLRATSARLQVLGVLSAVDHATPREIEERLAREESAPNDSSVYRALTTLVAHGFVVPLDIGARRVAFQLADRDPRHRLVCTICGDEIVLAAHLAERFAAALKDEHSFTMPVGRLRISGLCDACGPTSTGTD